MEHSQHFAWDREYQDPSFVSLSNEPSSHLLQFLKWVREDAIYNDRRHPNELFADGSLSVLDIGCGNGRHVLYMAQQYGSRGFGYDVSPTVIAKAKEQAKELEQENNVQFFAQSIADSFTEVADNSVSLIIDAMASHALYAGEHAMMLQELYRVMHSDGWLFVRTLCKDGDANAKKLMKASPGPELDTYLLPQNGMMERVWSEEDFRNTYGEFFEIEFFKKHSGHQRWPDKVFKRRYLSAYLRKK